MKNHTKTPEYCDYSFDDLHKAAFGKSLDIDRKQKLQRLSQKRINKLVLDWAEKAGWKTRIVRSGLKEFLSFWP